MLEILKKLDNVRNCANVIKILKDLDNVEVSKIAYGYYHIIIGAHSDNIFIDLYLSQVHQCRFNATIREFNGVNYDLYKSVSVYMNRNGYFKLISFFDK